MFCWFLSLVVGKASSLGFYMSLPKVRGLSIFKQKIRGVSEPMHGCEYGANRSMKNVMFQ